jgi:hypothetical protein
MVEELKKQLSAQKMESRSQRQAICEMADENRMTLATLEMEKSGKASESECKNKKRGGRPASATASAKAPRNVSDQSSAWKCCSQEFLTILCHCCFMRRTPTFLLPTLIWMMMMTMTMM